MNEDDILEYTDSSTKGLAAVRVINIDAIWPCDDNGLDEDGDPVPPGTCGVISTPHSVMYAIEDSAILITRWKRQLKRVLARE